jgi:hypothetical protein
MEDSKQRENNSRRTDVFFQLTAVSFVTLCCFLIASSDFHWETRRQELNQKPAFQTRLAA